MAPSCRITATRGSRHLVVTGTPDAPYVVALQRTGWAVTAVPLSAADAAPATDPVAQPDTTVRVGLAAASTTDHQRLAAVTDDDTDGW